MSLDWLANIYIFIGYILLAKGKNYGWLLFFAGSIFYCIWSYHLAYWGVFSFNILYIVTSIIAYFSSDKKERI